MNSLHFLVYFAVTNQTDHESSLYSFCIFKFLLYKLYQMTSNQIYGSHYGRAKSSKKESIGRNTLEFLVKNDTGNYIQTQENIAQRNRHDCSRNPWDLQMEINIMMQNVTDQVPKNVSVNKRLVQKVGPQLFQKMGSTNIGDLYKDKYKENQIYSKQKVDLSIHNHPFQAGGSQKIVKHSEFQHMKEFEDKTYNTRDEQGNVKTGKKNITTNNMKRGFGSTTVGHLFGSYKYQGAPYDNQNNMENNEKLNHKAKILKPFVGSSNPQATFTPHYQTYHLEGEAYQPKNDDVQYRNKTTQKWTYNNPNKKGFYGTFSEFPKYIQNGQKQRLPVAHQNVWRPNFNGTSKGSAETQTKPCPVPSQMVLNDIRRTKN